MSSACSMVFHPTWICMQNTFLPIKFLYVLYLHDTALHIIVVTTRAGQPFTFSGQCGRICASCCPHRIWANNNPVPNLRPVLEGYCPPDSWNPTTNASLKVCTPMFCKSLLISCLCGCAIVTYKISYDCNYLSHSYPSYFCTQMSHARGIILLHIR